MTDLGQHRTLKLTATEVANLPTEGTFWLVREASYDLRCPTCGGSASLPFEMTCADHRPVRTPPAEFVQACAPCDNGTPHKMSGDYPCGDCEIELVGPCQRCKGAGFRLSDDGYRSSCSCGGGRCSVHVGFAYAVGQPLPIYEALGDAPDDVESLIVADAEGAWLVNFGAVDAIDIGGPPESLVGKWAVELKVVGS